MRTTTQSAAQSLLASGVWLPDTAIPMTPFPPVADVEPKCPPGLWVDCPTCHQEHLGGEAR